LLAIGVLFVILAAGYLLKYSFDQGWVSPLVRCISGALAGVAIGAIGWRLYGNALRTYGAALIGCGAALIYLAVWAASYLYLFLPPPEGIAGLALVSLALAAVAFVVDVQALGATAVLGAFLAPVLLGRNASNADLLLVYLSFMAFTLGWVAARKHWRLASALIAFSYFGLAFTGGAGWRAEPWRVLLFGVLGGSFGLYVGLREGWWETRFLSFGGGWGLIVAASERIGAPWAVVLAGLGLALPVWRHALRAPAFWPIRRAEGDQPTPWSVGETLYFFVTPILLGWAVHLLDPELFLRQPGLVPWIIAAPYLAAGYSRVHPEFALVGTTAAGFAALAQWSGLEAVWALLALSLLWAALDHPLARSDGRWYGLLALAAGLSHLVFGDATARSDFAAAFVDGWALTLWAAIGCVVAMARGLWKARDADAGTRGMVPAFWTVAGVLLLFGVTGELGRFFALRNLEGSTAALWTGLTISVWWILFASGLVLLGFRRDLKRVRQAGLLVAAMAAVKILVHDLSSLDALYRVGSVFITGLVSLLLAYLYNRRARDA